MSFTNSLLTSLVLSAILAAPAHADWQGVPFGVTDDELPSYVPDARPNENREKDDEDLAALMTMPYNVGDIEADAYFKFDAERRLQEVELVIRSLEDCSSALLGVARVYGPSEDETDLNGYAVIYNYRDQENGNLVSVLAPSSPTSTLDCSVNYRPFPTGGEPGGF